MEIQKTWIIYVLAQNLYQFKYHITFLLLLHRTQQLVMCMIDIYNSTTCGAFVLKVIP